jgi:hypothetical protein
MASDLPEVIESLRKATAHAEAVASMVEQDFEGLVSKVEDLEQKYEALLAKFEGK